MPHIARYLLILLIWLPLMASDVHAGSVTWYVSKAGDGSTGRSWAGAWKELSAIKWRSVAAGDTIVIDGGTTAMTYTTTLAVGRSGITIRASNEAGRNGKVIIFGGRSTPLPECGTVSYTQPASARRVGIDFGERDNVRVDGLRWRGITIYGHTQWGINLNPGNTDITIRNVEIYDNGLAYIWDDGLWYSDAPGVDLSGTRVTVERAIIHDNGNDAFQSNGGVRDFTLRQSWLYNSRPHSTDPSIAWNDCTHSDGIQVYAGGHQYGITVEQSVIGPMLTNGFMLTGYTVIVNGEPRWGTVHNVTIRDSLLYGSNDQNLAAGWQVDADKHPTNYTFENVTSYREAVLDRADCDPIEYWNNIGLTGTGHMVSNSIFYGGCEQMFTMGTVPSDGRTNCSYAIKFGISRIDGLIADPRFADAAHGDFTVTEPLCQTRGSPITSPIQLLSLPE